MPLSSCLERENPIVLRKATGSTSVNTRGVGGKGTARKGRCTAKAKLTAAAELKTSCKARCACTPMRQLGGLEELPFCHMGKNEKLKVHKMVGLSALHAPETTWKQEVRGR